MPIGNPAPRNLTDLVRAGGIDDAVDLRDRGYSGQRLREKLSSLYPSAFPQSVRALADRSILVRQAVREVLLAPPQAEMYEFAIGGEFLDRSVSVSSSAYPRLEAWYEQQRRLAAAGDEVAAAKIESFHGRIEIGNVKLTAVVRGRE